MWNVSNDDLSLDRVTRVNYQINESIEIQTGQNLYDKILESRNGLKNERKAFEDFENFLRDNFFDCENLDLISNPKVEGEIKVYLDGEDIDRKIHDLGDGVQSIINLIYPLYTAKEKTWFFYEEPEINLHPKFQKIFLNQLIKFRDKGYKFFITTHSNHLLDLSLSEDGISIFTFQKKKNKSLVEIRNVVADDNILKLLGVNNSSVFISNCSLWIEGISERKYIGAFLKA